MKLPLGEDPRPPYVQAADVLRAAIHDGELRPGERLPAARELQRRFGIASSTVQNALRVLKEEGLIYSVLGRGSYVRPPKPPVPTEKADAFEEDEVDPGESDPEYIGLGDLRSGLTVPLTTPARRMCALRTSSANRSRTAGSHPAPSSRPPATCKPSTASPTPPRRTPCGSSRRKG
ncbi:hypothetical protein GCM10023324_09790 [Streptomyces youssoufiensis]